MKLSIYSLKKILYDGEVESLNCKTKSGEITVLDHHRPLISALATGAIKIVDKEKKEHYVPVNGGFLEINSENRVKLIVDA